MRTITTDEISNTITMPKAIEAVRSAFIDFANGEFELMPRVSLQDGAFLTMLVLHRPSRTVMTKSLSLNFESRSPAILGSVSLVSYHGQDVVVGDAGLITALRTGAVSGVATDLLAPTDASVGLVIGAGRQAREQARAVASVRPLERLILFDVDETAAEALRDRLVPELRGVTVEVSFDLDSSVADADVVCCATSSKTPVFDAKYLKTRVHVNGIGSFTRNMQEMPPDVFADAEVVVDDVAAALMESGEICAAVESGSLTTIDLTPLGDALLRGTTPTGRSVFKSVGLGIQDWAMMRLLASR